MIRVTSLTAMSDRQLSRWTKRIALLLVVLTVAFVAFYVADRFRVPAAPMLDQRLVALEQAVRDDPADITSRGQLADLYTAAGRYPEAIAQYTAILDSGKEAELAHFGRAQALKASGDLDAAIVDFEAVVGIAKDGEMANVDPMLEAAYFGLGAIALEQARPADAVEHLTAAVAIKRGDADAWNLLATALLQTGDNDKAIEAAKKAVAFVPLGWTEPYATMAQAWTAKGDTARAEWANAMIDLSTGDNETAKTRLLAITDGETALDAAMGLGLVFERAGDATAAAEWYTKALAIDPGNAAARLGLGRVTEPAASAAPHASNAPNPAGSPLPELPKPGDVNGGQG